MIMSGKSIHLIPMSKIAGNLAIQKGMQFLEYSSKGKGLLLSSISGEKIQKSLLLVVVKLVEAQFISLFRLVHLLLRLI